MNRKKLPSSEVPTISPDEWDFSSFANEDPHLRTVIEYEYLRSSPLREKIIEWQARSCGETAFARSPFFNIAVVRAAKLISVPDTSPLGQLQAVIFKTKIPGRTPAECAHNTEELNRLMKPAKEQMSRLVWPFTIRDAIRRILKLRTTRTQQAGKISDHDIHYALAELEKDVPPELKQIDAERVCARFDCFPNPLVTVLREKGASYLKRRCSLSAAPSLAWSEIPREDAGLLLPPNKPTSAPGHRIHVFSVDWSQNPEKIRSEFSEWLSARHPESKTGARRFAEWLNRLSLYRLKEIGGFKDAQAKRAIRERRDGKDDSMLIPRDFGSAQTWSNLRRRVKNDLHGNFIASLRRDLEPVEDVKTGMGRFVIGEVKLLPKG